MPERFPPIDLFERVADPADWDAVIAVESLTNDRLRDAVGDISLVSPEDRVSGPGASYIMAAFTHPAPGGGRFTDGTTGAYYTAAAERTAVAETRYHRERFLRATAVPPIELAMRVVTATLDADLHDVRGDRARYSALYDLNSYTASQALGRTLVLRRSWGIAYESVRDADPGECAAVFRPRALAKCRVTRHLGYLWNGDRITHVIERRLRA